MHSLNTLIEMNEKEVLKRKVLRLKKSKGFQRQQYPHFASKFFKRYGEKI